MIIKFKSEPQYWHPEMKGLKNWTAREIDLTDQRFRELYEMWLNAKYGEITIVNTESGDIFTRKIRHITIYKNWMFITWTPLVNS